MCRLSKEKRGEAFLALAGAMNQELKAWNNGHAEASFEEIEALAREKRRALLGEGLAILVNGRTAGMRQRGSAVPGVAGGWPTRERGSGRPSTGWKAIRVWNAPTTSARPARGRRFLPLDEKLGLRADSWSGGAARVMTRCGLREPSFGQAAEGYQEATGGQVSGAGARRVTQVFGRKKARQQREAGRAAERGQFEEVPQERWLDLQAPLGEAANLSAMGR